MNYPGNPSLSSAVKDRVVSTFQQTLALYQQGRTEDVTAGCTLILQMDPMFDPAKKLLEKMRNPALPIDVATLMPADERSPMQQAREAMADRDFQRVIHLTTEVLTNDLLNDEARILGDDAREKLEAAPFVEQFTRRCDASIASGNIAAAKMELEKARALDPTHPDVVRIGRTLSAHDATPSAPAPSFAPSFIVDEPAPPASGRGTAQATDFGFAFEEEKPAEEVSFANFSFDTPSNDSPFGGGFSFDAPAAPAAPPPPAAPTSGPGEFDFATASIVTSDDDQKKIEQYLADGDRAFSAGDYQQSIDLWSRIFLIDVTNDEASDRIERAKAKRREAEQKIEPLLASGITAFERGDTARAHADLNEVLRLDPHNASAQEYLDRLEETIATGAAPSNPYIAPSVADDDNLNLGYLDEDAGDSTYDEVLVPPPPPAGAPAADTRTTGKREAAPKAAKAPSAPRKLPMGLIAAVLALVLLAVGGWFVWNNFMNKPEEDFGATQAILARASTLAGSGKYDQAIKLLQDIKPDDPQHDEALVMIADLRAKKSSSAAMIEGVPAQQFYDQKLAAGISAIQAHDYVGAKAAFEKAMLVKPLPPDLKAQYDSAAQQVAKLESAKALFDERKYADAISNLQPLLVQDPQNQNIRRMIVNAHFNLGAVALQEEKLSDAVREFDEVLKVNPNDELAKRSRDLATRYDNQPKDLLYKIYVKYLPLRQAA